MKTLLEEARFDRIEVLPEVEFKNRWGISTLFLGVPDFCRITGLPRSTVYQYIREGRFFLPHFVVNKTPLIKTEDFLEWYRSGCVVPDRPISINHLFAK